MSVDDSTEIHWFLVQIKIIPQVTFNIHPFGTFIFKCVGGNIIFLL